MKKLGYMVFINGKCSDLLPVEYLSAKEIAHEVVRLVTSLTKKVEVKTLPENKKIAVEKIPGVRTVLKNEFETSDVWLIHSESQIKKKVEQLRKFYGIKLKVPKCGY